MTDITAYRDSEKALRESKERYRDVVETQKEMICRCLPDTTLTFVNDAYCRYFGKTRTDLIGRKFLDLLPEAEQTRVLEIIKATVGGLHSGPSDQKNSHPDGSTRWVQWVNHVLRHDSVDIEVQSIGRDITEQKRAEEALQKNQEELRRSHAHIQQLAGCLMRAQEEERRHIARELHDDFGQQIAGLSISLSNIKRQLSPSNSIAHQVQQVQEYAKSIANGVRSLSHALHPVALEHAGLAAALKSLITEFSTSRVRFSLSMPECVIPLPDHIAICIYRIAQESIRNIVTHSGARHAEIELFVDKSCINLLISDDGCGFEIEEARKKSGLGLVSMAERVGLLQGVFELRTNPGDGTFLRATVPLTSDQKV